MVQRPYAVGVERRTGRKCICYCKVGSRIYNAYNVHKDQFDITLFKGINLLSVM
jgi:hypothetical protein